MFIWRKDTQPFLIIKIVVAKFNNFNHILPDTPHFDFIYPIFWPFYNKLVFYYLESPHSLVKNPRRVTVELWVMICDFLAKKIAEK